MSPFAFPAGSVGASAAAPASVAAPAIRSVDREEGFDRLTDAEFGRQLVALRGRLGLFARKLCGCPAEAEDLVSDCMVRAWAARDRFQAGTSMSAWCTLILRNGFLTKARRGKFSGGSVEDLAPSSLPSCRPQQYAAVDLADAMKALAELPREQREAMTLIAHGATYEEAAEEACISVGTIKSRVGRGRDRLQELLS